MYWDAYLADTTHLSTEEHGAYLLLLAAMWRRDGWVPDDDRDNARIVGLTLAKWLKVKARLSDFLEFEDGMISQRKLRETWNNTQEKIEKNRENGAKGGRPKLNKSNGMEKSNGSAPVNPNKTIPDPELKPEPSIRDKDTDVSLVNPPQVNDLLQAVSSFNTAAEKAGWPTAQKLSSSRSRQLRARLNECGGLDGWDIALRKAFDSDFCRGRTAKPWDGFGFDWLIKAANFTKLMEGNYDNRDNHAGRYDARTGRPGPGMAQAFAAVAARRSRGPQAG